MGNSNAFSQPQTKNQNFFYQAQNDLRCGFEVRSLVELICELADKSQREKYCRIFQVFYKQKY